MAQGLASWPLPSEVKRKLAAPLTLGQGGIGRNGAAGLDIGHAALGVIDQQQVDALSSRRWE
jgi:hypothetical protein